MGEIGFHAASGLGLAEQISKSTSQFITKSSNQRDLLDIVDTLRAHGLSHYVDLPQIIVCGSQSSGKSSTLEAISGIEFPTAEGLCTRFATELILRRGQKVELKVLIQPAPGREEVDKIRLATFSKTATQQEGVASIIESAKSTMGLSGTESKVFSADVLRIESTSPDAPNLTLVDLPGLFGASDKNQSDDDADMVKDLVVGYMKQRRSIILAVVSADTAFANQPVTKFAREIDPSGSRTLGLITKPDKLDKGSDSERYYVEMAQNENVKLDLGWHVLRNKSHATIEDTADERDEKEADFFLESAWNVLDQSQLGIATLRTRLRDALWKQIKEGIPGVKSEVQFGIKDCHSKLQQFGESRSTQREKHTYLHRIASRLSVMTRAAIDGVYGDPFFESYPGQTDPFKRRLRAHIQKILTEYAEEMRIDGHALEIVEDDQEPTRSLPSKYIKREEHLGEVRRLLIEGKGRELPGTFNPLVVGDLFSRQCKPWELITQHLAEVVHAAASSIFSEVISTICDSVTKGKLIKSVIQPSLHRLRADLKDKFDELLKPHQSIHPITYNHYLTESVQKIQAHRHHREFDDLVAKHHPVDSKGCFNITAIECLALLKRLKFATEPNMENYSASLAADVAAAYYKVALKKFIDDISVDAVETCLIQRLPKVFDPDVVWNLSDEDVEELGSEDDATVKERNDLQVKLRVLEVGLRDLDTCSA